MANVGDLIFRLVADSSGLLKDAEKAGGDAGDKAATTFGSKFNDAAKKLLTGALTGGFAIATKGLLDLDSATARYRATTGATQADVEKMQRTTLELNRHNLENIDQVSDVLATLRTDLGMTQDQADAAAQSFLDYAHATGTDAVGAVKAFDDILDAWGLQATDAIGIMDKLTASHQKYGGSIEGNQQALAVLAPQLKALGTDVDGAIGLLNLFASSGIDASKATAALNTAVAKLKPGQTIDDLITKIAAIEDPTQRAKAAIEAFGARGGVALANALKPGVTGLKDFEVSSADAAGATKKAADQINDSIENRIKLAIKDFGGAIIQLAAPAGPVLMGIGSVVTGIHSIGTALGIEAATAGAKWAAILGPIAIFGAATVAAFAEIEAKRKEDTATHEAEAQKQGGIYGAMAAAAIHHAETVGKAMTTISTAVETNTDTAHTAGAGFAADADEMANRWQGASDSILRTLSTMKDGTIGTLKDTADGAIAVAREIPPAYRIVGAEALQKMADGINSARQAPLDAFDALVKALKTPMTETKETARLLGELASKELAAGLKSGDPEIRAQARATKESILERLNELTPGAGTVGKKGMEELAKAMKSADPEIRAQARAIYETIEAQLALKDAKLWAQHAAEAYAQGFASREDFLAEKTRTFLRGASAQMIAESPPKAGPLKEIDKWGERTGYAWVDAFIAALETSVGKTHITLAKVQKAVTSFIGSYSPIGDEFGGLTPEADRANLQQYIANLRAQLPTVTDPAKRLEILRQIIEYESRLTALQGVNATKQQETAQTIQGYIDKLDKALLTATDPKRVKELTDELLVYIARLDAILHPKVTGAGTSSAPPAAPPVDARVDASGKPTGHYEHIGDSWIWVDANGVPAFTPPTTLTSADTNFRGVSTREGGAPQGPQINVQVNNPAPEPASTSTSQQLRLLAATGILG